ncbi:hypothetical protein OVA24_10295 [Luteolibacter sp. SL250]|uniref:hypothetical protein n=1 Tax=Luteolibacter sp. SL250 TaxID=2995170 RepID=UPI002270518A|nr:hypothetical protein [Luteolibacter sp. SL250]WAC21775.1 hypothetical protein OVA24_10295 [Luteolibacter sp. SL250]
MKSFLSLIALTVPLASISSAQDPAAENAKLREALRTTAVQLRTAQADLANAQAITTASEAKNKQLESQLAQSGEKLVAQTKKADQEKTAAEQTIAGLNNKLADRDKRLAEYTEAITKWKAAYQQAATVSQAKTTESRNLTGEVSSLKLVVSDRERKNIALFNAAREILDRYESHALGKAILAKEPFTRNSRVQIENLVQGYNDRILDNRISGKPSN